MKKKGKFLLTNFVTLLRVIGIGALIPVYQIYGGLATFLLSAGCFATDCIDGLMARKFKTSSFFGSLFDGISDKGFLIINMILLMSITPLAIIPIIFELGIATVQTLKYQNNLNVKSNIWGKAKMWIAGVIISLSYLLVDQNFLSYLGADLVTKIGNMDQIKLFSTVLFPLVASEVVTLGTYINEYKKEKAEITEEEKEEKRIEEAKVIEEAQNYTTKEVLFSNEFYETYKDCNNMKLIRSLIKKKNKNGR